jgi:hypothetical protein
MCSSHRYRQTGTLWHLAQASFTDLSRFALALARGKRRARRPPLVSPIARIYFLAIEDQDPRISQIYLAEARKPHKFLDL